MCVSELSIAANDIIWQLAVNRELSKSTKTEWLELCFLFVLFFPRYVNYADQPKLDIALAWNQETSNSALCVPQVPPETFSTRRDVIFNTVVKRNTGLAPCLLSIRSCGCQARIIILTDDSHTFDEVTYKVILYVGAEIVVHKNVQWGQGAGIADELRLSWMRQWLAVHHTEVDRCLHADAFDVLYFRDPFGYLVEDGKMTFVKEGKQIYAEWTNMHWLRNCYGNGHLSGITHEMVVCSGTVAGVTAQFRKYLDIMLHGESNHLKCQEDQPQLNYMLYTGHFSENGLSYTFRTCNDVVTVETCMFKTVDFKGINTIRSPNGSVPVMVHQFPHRECFVGLANQTCNVSNFISQHVA